jgi:hypothetical protein
VLVQKNGHSPGEEKMSKFKFITLAASIMLALAFTLSCSQDNISGPDGSLNGTWERAPLTTEIHGAEFISKYDGVNEYKGTVTYDGSSISFRAVYYWKSGSMEWATIPTNPEPVRANYTLSTDGKTMTISGGDKEELNGDWTKKQ